MNERSQLLDIDGARTRLRAWGEGAPALLLHGVPTSGALWRPAARRLRGIEALAPDLPGYGESEALPDPTLEAHVRWAEALLDGLGLDRCPIIGQDYGGLIAAALAARGRASALGLTSTAAGRLWLPIRATALPLIERPFYRRYGGRLFLSRGVAPDRQAGFLAEHLPWLESRPDLPAQMRQLAARGLPAGPLAELPAQIRARRIPIRCIWGADDRFFPTAVGRWTARRLGGDLTVIPAARHYAPWCRPEPYAREIAALVAPCTSTERSTLT